MMTFMVVGGMRHYPPGVIFHAPHCVDGGSAVAIPVAAAFAMYPAHRFDTCFSPIIPIHRADQPETLAAIMPYISVERLLYAEHAYSPAVHDHRVPRPPDAIRPLCRLCRGTHEGEA